MRLLAAACQGAFDHLAVHKIERCSDREIDWASLLRLAEFHRVEGLAWRGFERAGVAIPEALGRRAQAIAARNLAAAASCRELLDRFEQAGLPILFLKGLPLGTLAYGQPWLKSAVDVDLLVDGSKLAEAIELLRACGYRRQGGQSETLPALRHWHRFRKDSEWAKAGSTTPIDLHTRLTDNPALISSIGIGSPRQIVEITPGFGMPTLADDEMFAHLCVHGASSAWFRLKWVTDLAALLHPKSPDEIVRLYHRSQELGAGRASGQALLLANALYATLGGCPNLRDQLESEPWTRWLYRSALRQLVGRPEPVEPTMRAGGTLRIHLTQFLLLRGIAFKASEFIRQLRAATT